MIEWTDPTIPGWTFRIVSGQCYAKHETAAEFKPVDSVVSRALSRKVERDRECVLSQIRVALAEARQYRDEALTKNRKDDLNEGIGAVYVLGMLLKRIGGESAIADERPPEEDVAAGARESIAKGLEAEAAQAFATAMEVSQGGIYEVSGVTLRNAAERVRAGEWG